MSTTAPENSVQTIGRLAWTGAKVAYGAAVVEGILTPCVPQPPISDTDMRVDEHMAEYAHAEIVGRASELRQCIDDALKIKPGEDAYAESADAIVEGLKIMRSAEFDHAVWRKPLDPAKRADIKGISAWAREMLPIWKKIRIVRLKQQKVIQDEYLIKMGAKSEFDVWWEKSDFQLNRSVMYLFRFLIFGAIFMLIWVAIDPSSAQAFDDLLPRYNSGSWILGISRWLGMEVD